MCSHIIHIVVSREGKLLSPSEGEGEAALLEHYREEPHTGRRSRGAEGEGVGASLTSTGMAGSQR